MHECHRNAIAKLVELHRHDPQNLALVICGSLASGEARPDSDVDFYLVVAEEEFARAQQTKHYFRGCWDKAEFFGIETDGKAVGMQYLREAADHGSEPTRASFQGAYTVFSRDAAVDALIPRIAAYPEAERDKKLKAFYGQVKHYRYVGEQAFAVANEYEAWHCVSELVFFAARLVLAHNRVLFPCHKSLFRAVARCPQTPADFATKSMNVLKKRDWLTTIAFYEEVIDYFKEHEYSDTERVGLILENEWCWFTRTPSVADW